VREAVQTRGIGSDELRSLRSFEGLRYLFRVFPLGSSAWGSSLQDQRGNSVRKKRNEPRTDCPEARAEFAEFLIEAEYIKHQLKEIHMDAFLIFIVWLLLSCLVAAYANRRYRSGIGFFFLSLFLTPIVGFILAAMGRSDPERAGLRKCPSCAEFIKAEALKCRFCQHDFTMSAHQKVTSQPGR
jgi:hypothetical protein